MMAIEIQADSDVVIRVTRVKDGKREGGVTFDEWLEIVRKDQEDHPRQLAKGIL